MGVLLFFFALERGMKIQKSRIKKCTGSTHEDLRSFPVSVISKEKDGQGGPEIYICHFGMSLYENGTSLE